MRIAVTDTGVGIPAADQPKLFEQFFRARNAVETEESGAGLGLRIARSLVELHGGELGFESALNAGSTFFFTLPIADAPADALEIL